MTDTTHDGRLIYVVGPSGAGKDSVIAAAKENLFNIKYLYFAPRYITRTGDECFDDISISADAFAHYKSMGEFALDWQAHGLHYGISIGIENHLRADRTVVVNGSRAYVPAALDRYPHLTVVSITVPPAVARDRLYARGREDAEAIAERLQRAPDIDAPAGQLITIDNSGPLEYATQALLHVLIGDGRRGRQTSRSEYRLGAP